MTAVEPVVGLVTEPDKEALVHPKPLETVRRGSKNRTKSLLAEADPVAADIDCESLAEVALPDAFEALVAACEALVEAAPAELDELLAEVADKPA